MTKPPDTIAKLVEEYTAPTSGVVNRTRLQHAIKRTDKKIDGLVYKMYNLTDEEIKIVEEGVK